MSHGQNVVMYLMKADHSSCLATQAYQVYNSLDFNILKNPEKRLHMTEQSGVVPSEKEKIITKHRESVKLKESTSSGKPEPVHHHSENLYLCTI